MSYIVISYPFSRTTWLAALLNEMDGPCLHEKSMDFSSLSEFKEFFDKYEGGVVDTALINVHHKLGEYKLALIVNDISSVKEELTNRNLPNDLSDYQKKYVDKALANENIYKIRKEDLSNHIKVKELCDYLGVTFKEDVFNKYKDYWITTDFLSFVEKVINSNKDYSWLLNKEEVKTCH